MKEMYPEEPPRSVLYCYGIYQPLFDKMKTVIPNIRFHEGLPTMETVREFTADRRHRLIVLDDLMHSVVCNVEMELLFTQGCHHRRISVLFLTKNLYVQGSRSRSIALNTSYLVLMRNVRGIGQIATLSRQLYPGKSKILTDATGMTYGYLVVDLSPHSDDTYRLRTNVFPGEDPIVYVHKS